MIKFLKTPPSVPQPESFVLEQYTENEQPGFYIKHIDSGLYLWVADDDNEDAEFEFCLAPGNPSDRLTEGANWWLVCKDSSEEAIEYVKKFIKQEEKIFGPPEKPKVFQITRYFRVLPQR